MKQITRHCCPACGKDNWDRKSCGEHGELWRYYATLEEPDLKRAVRQDIFKYGGWTRRKLMATEVLDD